MASRTYPLSRGMRTHIWSCYSWPSGGTPLHVCLYKSEGMKTGSFPTSIWVCHTASLTNALLRSLAVDTLFGHRELSCLQVFSYGNSEGVKMPDHRFMVCLLQNTNINTLQTMDIGHYYDKWWNEHQPNTCLEDVLSRFQSLKMVELTGSYRFTHQAGIAHGCEDSGVCMRALHDMGVLRVTNAYPFPTS